MSDMSNLPKMTQAVHIVQFCEKHQKYEWNMRFLVEYFTYLNALHVCSKN